MVQVASMQREDASMPPYMRSLLAQNAGTLQVNMSVAVIPMAADLGWSPSDRGLVSSAFFWGYSLTQIPAGWVSTR